MALNPFCDKILPNYVQYYAGFDFLHDYLLVFQFRDELLSVTEINLLKILISEGESTSTT